MEDQFLQHRRPHINFDNIYSQISNFCKKIYDGTFNDIFLINSSAISETIGIETALPANEYNLLSDNNGNL